MRIIRDLTEFTYEKSAVAIGKFDGVHRGHRKLLATLVEEARSRGLTPAVFTFDPPPAVLFGGEDAAAAPLLSDAEQQAAFEALGVEVLVAFPFTRETAAIPPEDFVRGILSEKLHAALIVCGDDVSFGAGGKGDLRMLKDLAAELDCDVLVVDKVKENGTPISSTRIRQALREGHEQEARHMMV